MTSADADDDHVSALRSWRRTGLVAGWAAALLLGGSFLWRLVGPDGSTGTVVLAGAAVLAALVAYAYLRRLWTDPHMAERSATPLLRRLSAVAAGAYGLAVLPNVVRAGGVELSATVEWTVVLLGGAAVVGFLALLVVASRPGSRP